MTDKKEFTLDSNLEQLVKLAGLSKNIADSSDEKVDNNTIAQAAKFYSDLSRAGISNINPNTFGPMSAYDFAKTMRIGESQVHAKLEASLDDNTYKTAKNFYLGSLDENHKMHLHLEMLKEGAIPDLPSDAKDSVKEAYAALKKAKNEVDLAEAIEKAVSKGNIEDAGELVRQHLDVYTVGYLSVLGGYGGPTFRNAEKGVYLDIAKARKNVAAKLVKDNNLGGLIEQGMDEKVGKASSMVNMYSVYQGQVKYNEAKAKEEANRKK